MFKTVDKEKFLSLMAIVAVLSYVLGAKLDDLFVEHPHTETIWAAISSGVEHVTLGFTVFLPIFSTFLWKLAIFRWLGVVKFPDLSGTWKGTGKSATLSTEYLVNCKISQDAWTVSWNCVVFGQGEGNEPTSQNKCLAATFTKDELDNLFLTVLYRNEVQTGSPAKFSADHWGACRLKFQKTRNRQASGSVLSLDGDYWTNKSVNECKCTAGKFALQKEPSWIRRMLARIGWNGKKAK